MNISYFPAKDNQSYDGDGEGECVVEGDLYTCTVTGSQASTGEHSALPEPIIPSIPAC